MSSRLTIDAIKKKLYETHKGLVSLDESTYTNISSKAQFVDAEYGEWAAKVSQILSGGRHPKRALKERRIQNKLSAQTVSQRIGRIHEGRVTLNEETYTDTKTRATFVDVDFGMWEVTPASVLAGKGHPKRGRKNASHKQVLSPAQVSAQVQEIHGDQIKLDESTYQGMLKKSRFTHKEYGEWVARPNDVICGKQSHPDSCHKNSKPQGEIKSWIESLGISAVESSKVPGYRHEIDLFIENCNLGVEYHGLYWHSQGRASKYKHYQKREMCESSNLRLLQFFADEWENKPNIVKSIIQSHLRINQTQVYARKCEIRFVQNKDAQTFLSENHLMGKYTPARYIGLFHKDQLISLLGYKKSKNIIEISRFCNLLNHNVPGGLSKFLKYIEKTEKPTEIISWVDLRYGNGHSLEAIGFKRVKETLGWRWTDCRVTYNRLKCRANMDSRKLSQQQHAEELGLTKIYDAGQALYKKYTS